MSRRISDFRPISLITSLYKIIAKVLAGRIRGWMRKEIREEGVVFKIDFEKAYDHVSWDFLDHVLEMKVLVNGNAKGWVKASRGLRQGDPLSPFLFTIVADVLSRMLLKAEERNVLEGFRNHLSRLAEMLDCKAFGWPILYLGLPLGGNPKACGFWDPVIERISRRLDEFPPLWQQKLRECKEIFMVRRREDKRDHLVNWDVGNGDRIRLWDDLWWGEQPWESNIQDYLARFRGPYAVFDRLHISPSVPDKRSWSLSPLGLFTVNLSFWLSQYSESPLVFPTKFVWNAQVPFKVKSFVWLVAHKKVNTNDLLQLRRPYKALSPDIYYFNQ
ncbi:hypothetical protein CK203_032617 [Vitis vinifera]|uniref:Reverse transcriptase domain-containing protein n=1 Tax=Vitis vinifera TaxID=29760 RepID=A0A438HXT1_VITVI|nr:hypothetical protein CK203_032617 [Vitis vinifera]